MQSRNLPKVRGRGCGLLQDRDSVQEIVINLSQVFIFSLAAGDNGKISVLVSAFLLTHHVNLQEALHLSKPQSFLSDEVGWGLSGSQSVVPQTTSGNFT
jgi:hypothetical protein